jgi:hypothetical protein
MKVLLQDSATHHYFTAESLWLQSAAHGRAFADISLALSFCRARGMFSANVILAFDDADLNVCLRGPRRSL